MITITIASVAIVSVCFLISLIAALCSHYSFAKGIECGIENKWIPISEKTQYKEGMDILFLYDNGLLFLYETTGFVDFVESANILLKPVINGSVINATHFMYINKTIIINT